LALRAALGVGLRVAETPGSALRIDGLARRGGFALELSLHVQAGEVLGVIGPNGAGKTTLLRLLAGLTPLSTGRVVLGDTVLDEPATGTFLGAADRPVGLVFQDYRLFPHLSVRDNVAFSPRVRGSSRSQARRVAERWLARLDLTDFADRRPGALSGGQGQRVALARALAAEPALLLLDEPLSALDAGTRLETRAQLREHLRDFTGPTLVVTHDPVEAMVLADRLVVLESGRVVQQGSPAAVARRPATAYVAKLVGLNLYAGAVRSADLGRVHLPGGAELAVPRQTGAGQVLVALRPSAAVLSRDRPQHTSVRNVWPGAVTGLEPLADRVRVQVGGTLPVLVDVTAAAVAELGLVPGAAVWVGAKATELEVYPDPSPGTDPPTHPL